MKAFRFENHVIGLELQDIPVPQPGHGQALISVEAVGLCHSDAHVVPRERGRMDPHSTDSIWATRSREPSSSSGLGRRQARSVTVWRLDGKAGLSPPLAGTKPSGWGTCRATAHCKHLVKIPEGVTFAQAAVAADSMVTAYHAVVASAGVTRSTVVGIIGLGGLGLNGVTISALQGAEVYGVNVNTAKLDEAKRYGAIKCSSSLDDFSDVSFDVVIDFVGMSSTTAAAVSAVKTSGTVILVGLGATSVHIPLSSSVTRDITLRSSLGGTVEELETDLGLIASGLISPKVEEIRFEDIPNGLERLEGNQANGRLFASPRKA